MHTISLYLETTFTKISRSLSAVQKLGKDFSGYPAYSRCQQLKYPLLCPPDISNYSVQRLRILCTYYSRREEMVHAKNNSRSSIEDVEQQKLIKKKN